MAAALSGGVDSVVLLDILHGLSKPLGFRLSAVHVNHQISRNAKKWSSFCRKWCRGLGVPLKVVKVSVGGKRGASLEAAAREARYRVFSRQPADFVALAQHLDDQAETLLLQLLRGAGVKGLSAMPVIRSQRSAIGAQVPPILRPLLDVSRVDIEKYARAKKLDWVEDESNRDTRFDRNFLRHRVLPVLEENFPAYRKTLTRAAGHFTEAAEMLDDMARLDAWSAVRHGGLLIEQLQKLSAPRAKNLLRYHFASSGLPLPDSGRLDEILRQLLFARRDTELCVKHAGWEIHRFRGRVCITPSRLPPEPDLCLEWRGEKELKLKALGGVLNFKRATGRGISRQKLMGNKVTLRLRQGGERLRPDCKRPRRSLKNLMQELDIAPWERRALPLLYSGGTLVFAPGIGIECGYQAAGQEPGVVVTWRKNPDKL